MVEDDELVHYSTKVFRLVGSSTIRIMIEVGIIRIRVGIMRIRVGLMRIRVGLALMKFDLILFETDQEL